MKKLALIPLVMIFCAPLKAQSWLDSIGIYTPEDREIFYEYIRLFESRRDLPINELILETALHFLETAYVNFTLEVVQPAEKLVLNLRELDCTTYTEIVIALARTVKSGEMTFERFAREIKNIRFRGGVLDGFVSRLHYFTEWIHDNEEMGIVQNITQEMGGVNFPITFSLMTRAARNYPQMACPEVFQQIYAKQNLLSQRRFLKIPKARFNPANLDIKDGDIIVMTVHGRGMDVMHMGFAINIGDELYFLHASLRGRRVKITYDPFTVYAAGIRQYTGVMIVRVLEPNFDEKISIENEN